MPGVGQLTETMEWPMETPGGKEILATNRGVFRDNSREADYLQRNAQYRRDPNVHVTMFQRKCPSGIENIGKGAAETTSAHSMAQGTRHIGQQSLTESSKTQEVPLRSGGDISYKRAFPMYDRKNLQRGGPHPNSKVPVSNTEVGRSRANVPVYLDDVNRSRPEVCDNSQDGLIAEDSGIIPGFSNTSVYRQNMGTARSPGDVDRFERDYRRNLLEEQAKAGQPVRPGNEYIRGNKQGRVVKRSDGAPVEQRDFLAKNDGASGKGVVIRPSGGTMEETGVELRRPPTSRVLAQVIKSRWRGKQECVFVCLRF